jgi:hypothetical protein
MMIRPRHLRMVDERRLNTYGAESRRFFFSNAVFGVCVGHQSQSDHSYVAVIPKSRVGRSTLGTSTEFAFYIFSVRGR